MTPCGWRDEKRQLPCRDTLCNASLNKLKKYNRKDWESSTEMMLQQGYLIIVARKVVHYL